MGALQHVIVCSKRELCLESAGALRLIAIELAEKQVGVGNLEVVCRELTLVFQEHITVGEHRAVGAARPHQVVYRVDALDVHGQALKAIGDFRGDGTALEAANLLEVRELGHFHAVEPDFPAQAPCAKRRALPVVFHEADVVLFHFDADGAERLKVEILNIVGRRLQENLELIVMLKAVGVFAIAAVGRTTAWLNVGGFPRCGAKAAQSGCRMERTGSNLVIVRLHDHTAQICPVALKAQDHVLERQHLRGIGVRLTCFVVSHNAPYR